MTWELVAGCKVNVYLGIVGVRPNGYHEIESLFYPLPSPCDRIRVEEEGTGLRLSCSDATLNSESNIMSRAYRSFAHRTGFAPGVRVHLYKGIPMGAGLGGGSSDAATFLCWLNSRAGDRALTDNELAVLALSLGADVPYFLTNTPAWVTGVGENVLPVVYSLDEYVVLVVCPSVHVDTGWAYSQWDRVYGRDFLSRKELTPKNTPFKNPCFTKPPVLSNCFEEIVYLKYPELYAVKQVVLASKAEGCVMSGTGSSLVALFGSDKDAAQCSRRLQDFGCVCYASKCGEQISLDS